MPLQHIHPKQPPDQEYRDHGTDYVNYPVASCFRLPKIEHAAMVAGRWQESGNSPKQQSWTGGLFVEA